MGRARTTSAVAVAVTLLLVGVAACTGSGSKGSSTPSSADLTPSSPASSPATSPSAGATVPAPSPPRISKVMVIAEENESESAVIGTSAAPYLNGLARTYGSLTAMDAGYPVGCPSLAAYLILTSGSRDGICDDADPSSHQLSNDNIFRQVAAAGMQWREFAESMSGSCRRTNGGAGGYLVRHAPPPYYRSESSRCGHWDVPLGTTSSGALHDALARGLPAYSFVTPNACDDMHGAATCRNALVRRGDDWLARWIPRILASPDYRAGKLAVIVTWDEGSTSTNHIATVVIGPQTHRVVSRAAYTHCSTLRTTEEVLGLPLLGCARTARSYRAVLHL